MARNQREGEHTCYCDAYKFPHRFGGGKCTGMVIAMDTWLASWGSGVCADCNSFNSETVTCEVVEGLEDVSECSAYQEFVEYNEIKVY